MERALENSLDDEERMIIEKKSLATSQTKDIHIYMEPGISVYAGAIAGAMFAGKYAIKKVSDNGKYGISYNWIIGTPVVVPWRNG
nr:hypothetical protein [Bacillus velezensis]MDH3099523.1 hypothetical protein [Bacillus velezensis]WGE01506.1 hypothetical protein P5644_09635 [Bacillus velezensis]